MRTIIPDKARITFDDDGNLVGVEWWTTAEDGTVGYSVVKAKQPEGLDDAEPFPQEALR